MFNWFAKQNANIRKPNTFCWILLELKNWMTWYTKSKSIEHIDHVFLDCENILCSILKLVWRNQIVENIFQFSFETCLKKIEQVLHRMLLLYRCYNTIYIWQLNFEKSRKLVLTRSGLVVIRNQKRTLSLSQFWPLWSLFWVWKKGNLLFISNEVSHLLLCIIYCS